MFLGLFLLDNGVYLMLWVSRNGGPHIEQMFGNEQINQIDWEAQAVRNTSESQCHLFCFG